MELFAGTTPTYLQNLIFFAFRQIIFIDVAYKIEDTIQDAILDTVCQIFASIVPGAFSRDTHVIHVNEAS